MPEKTLAYAKQHKPDLILMPTHGWSVFRESLIGGVTAKVLHAQAARSRQESTWKQESIRRLPSPSQISLPLVILAPKARRHCPGLPNLPKNWRRQLTVVHVLPVLGQHESANQKLLKESAEANLSVLIEKLPLQPRMEILVGGPAEVICGYVNENASDLLVVGRGAIGHSLGRLRAQTYAMTNRSSCPVVSV